MEFEGDSVVTMSAVTIPKDRLSTIGLRNGMHTVIILRFVWMSIVMLALKASNVKSLVCKSRERNIRRRIASGIVL